MWVFPDPVRRPPAGAVRGIRGESARPVQGAAFGSTVCSGSEVDTTRATGYAVGSGHQRLRCIGIGVRVTMRKRLRFVVLSVWMSLAGIALGDPEATYRNPVIAGDFADPSVIRVGKTFYAAGTSSEWAPHYPLYTSRDLVNWEHVGYVFDEKPDWMVSSFWAPELYHLNDTFYVYYTVKRKSDGISCIGVATSKDPAGGFTDHGVIVEWGKEAIDAFVFDDNGQLYITWKAYGLDRRPIELLACRLSADGRTLQGEPFTLLKDDTPPGGMEGQCLIRHNGMIYLFYSAGGCCGRGCSYHVRVARAKTMAGPFVRYDRNPILEGDSDWMCSGHGTLVQTADDRCFYLYHAYNKRDNVYTGRQGLLDELLWDEVSGWPYFRYGPHPSIQAAAPWPGSTQAESHDIADDFNHTSLPVCWQWDFRHSEPSVRFDAGDLVLVGRVDSENVTGTVLTVRPTHGSYEMTTEVANRNGAAKGLVLYGDVSQAVGIACTGDRVQTWQVRQGRKSLLGEVSLSAPGPVFLRMAVQHGFLCRFYWSMDNRQWKELRPDGQDGPFYDAAYLPPWDRSARPGVIHSGSPEEPARFAWFRLRYE